jgi:hypothetical protein
MGIIDLIKNDPNIDPEFKMSLKGSINLYDKKPKYVFFRINEKYVGSDDFDTTLYDYISNIINMEAYIANLFVHDYLNNTKESDSFAKRALSLIDEHKLVLTKENGEEFEILSKDDVIQIIHKLIN